MTYEIKTPTTRTSTALIARGSNRNRVWLKYKLLDKQAKEVCIGDVVHTRREGAAYTVQNWDDTKVHVVCGEGKCHSFYPASLKLTIVEV